ncbi:hypothetical protein VTL71DRAFT_1573 [Oculimacula yallundae]|uniref:Uncharacterized protein n=1 Tax=Oculimacula yallundae TaxID=86028 RepID=A0ABR4CB26_9HELO
MCHPGVPRIQSPFLSSQAGKCSRGSGDPECLNIVVGSEGGACEVVANNKNTVVFMSGCPCWALKSDFPIEKHPHVNAGQWTLIRSGSLFISSNFSKLAGAQSNNKSSSLSGGRIAALSSSNSRSQQSLFESPRRTRISFLMRRRDIARISLSDDNISISVAPEQRHRKNHSSTGDDLGGKILGDRPMIGSVDTASSSIMSTSSSVAGLRGTAPAHESQTTFVYHDHDHDHAKSVSAKPGARCPYPSEGVLDILGWAAPCRQSCVP